MEKLISDEAKKNKLINFRNDLIDLIPILKEDKEKIIKSMNLSDEEKARIIEQRNKNIIEKRHLIIICENQLKSEFNYYV